jgi:hypothetical protein
MKKIGLLALALVLALGVLGVGFARWYDDLYIDGIVETGNIGAEWSIEGFYDDELKEVSWIDAYLVAPDTMYIDIYEAYPCVTYYVDFNIECTGSVPIHLGPPDIQTDLPAGATLCFPQDMCNYQLHHGDIYYGTLSIHLDNDAEQDWVYGFAITIEYAQYNEPFDCPPL